MNPEATISQGIHLLLQTEDLESFQIVERNNKKIIWHREEALTDIIEADFYKIDQDASANKNLYYESIGKIAKISVF